MSERKHKPHDEGTMSLSEMRRVLCKYRRPKYVNMPNDVSLRDIEIACKLHKNTGNRLANGLPVEPPLGRVRLRRISRFLERLEAGLVSKKNGVLVYHSPDEVKPKPPEIVYSISIPIRGAPFIRMAAPKSPPKSLPNLFKMADFFKGLR